MGYCDNDNACETLQYTKKEVTATHTFIDKIVLPMKPNIKKIDILSGTIDKEPIDSIEPSKNNNCKEIYRVITLLLIRYNHKNNLQQKK